MTRQKNTTQKGPKTEAPAPQGPVTIAYYDDNHNPYDEGVTHIRVEPIRISKDDTPHEARIIRTYRGALPKFGPYAPGDDAGRNYLILGFSVAQTLHWEFRHDRERKEISNLVKE